MDNARMVSPRLAGLACGRAPASSGQTAPGNALLQRARTAARWGMAAGVLGGCGYYLATRTDRVALARALENADYLLVLAMTVGHLIVVLPIKALRWGRMLAPIRRLPRRRLYQYCPAGCAVSNLIPARAGPAVRVLLLRRERAPLPPAVGTSLLE